VYCREGCRHSPKSAGLVNLWESRRSPRRRLSDYPLLEGGISVVYLTTPRRTFPEADSTHALHGLDLLRSQRKTCKAI
jgi:hypothetical protein